MNDLEQTSDDVANAEDMGNSASPDKPTERKSILFRIVQLFGVLALIGTWFGFLADWFWVADFVTQLTVQWTILLLCWILQLIWIRRWKFAMVAGVSAALNLVVVLPYFVPAALQTTAAADNELPTLRIAALNVLRTNTNFQSTFNQVLQQQPDVIYLSEVQPAWTDFLEDVRGDYPHQLRNMSLDYTGVVLLSKLPLENAQTFSIGKVPNPTYDFTVTWSDQKLRMIATHPLPPLGGDLSDARDQQLKDLVSRLDSSSAQLLMGDLNQSPWSPKFRRLLREGKLSDASLGYGIAPTLTPLPTWLGGVKVDHFLINQRVTVVNYQQHSISDSDHQLIVLDCQIH